MQILIQDHPVATVIVNCATQLRKCRYQLQRLCVHANQYPVLLKAGLQRCPYDLEFLPKLAFDRLIILVPEAPWWYLTPTPLIYGKLGGVLLQDPETVPSFLAVKMVLQAVPGPRGPQS